ncbi:TPA: adenylyltransferase/cytidyltransferase family protein [archaeon]|nr:adenylyltransferase/cytidyltransferase family protein [Candidatus Naiadarchaeales archaeon SRR2090159.bin1288]
MTNGKILELEDLEKKIAELKKQGKKVVQCHGVFDLLHVGHLRHFKQAKKFGDILVVTITPDKYVNKGPHRPAFPEKMRAEVLASLDIIDYVSVNKWPTAIETINLLKPNFYVKGDEYEKIENDRTKKILDEEQAIKSVGGEIKFTNDIVFSSTTLLNKHMNVFTEEIENYLIDFSKKYGAQQIIDYLDKVKNMKILVIGETIIDEYQYGTALGKAGKEPIIALEYIDTDKFAGGTLAIANHLAGFCDNISLFTLVGDRDAQEDFIESHLNKKVQRIFHKKKNSPTIVKRRFIEMPRKLAQAKSLKKLLEFYVINGEETDAEQTKKLKSELEKIIPQYDLVIVADFGHGMLNKELRDVIVEKSKFLAVNAQSNAGNMGYNTISKYKKADYICIDEPEIRLENRDKYKELPELMKETAKKLAAKKTVVTWGINGCYCYAEGNLIRVPAFSEKVFDTMGAGDAFLSITAPLAANNTPMEVIGFVGNAVGAMKVRTVGNKEPIDKVSLYKYIDSLLKW